MGIYRRPEDDPKWSPKDNPRKIRVQPYPGGGVMGSAGGGGLPPGSNLSAGDGISESGGLLNVNVDDSTIEIVSDILQVKDGGITIEKLSDEAIRTGFSVILSEIEVDQKVRVRAPFDFNITRISLLANTVGDLVLDIWKDTHANAPPTSSDSIVASAPPTLSSAQKSEDDTLTGWLTNVSVGDWLIINVDSVTDITEATLSVEADRN